MFISAMNAIKRKVKRLSRSFTLSGDPDRRYDFFEVGFHGDLYLLQLVDLIIRNCSYFIETGTNVGSTLAYVARKYPHIHCLSCEPNSRAFQQALKNTRNLPNASIYNQTSQEFLGCIETESSYLFDQDILFWLDAHGDGFRWPLKEELSFITEKFKRAYILIDDFKVPGFSCFGYDKYKGQICSFEYVKDVINQRIRYKLYYPNYTRRTSKHHPLRGWGLIEYGQHSPLEISGLLEGKVRPAL